MSGCKHWDFPDPCALCNGVLPVPTYRDEVKTPRSEPKDVGKAARKRMLNSINQCACGDYKTVEARMCGDCQTRIRVSNHDEAQEWFKTLPAKEQSKKANLRSLAWALDWNCDKTRRDTEIMYREPVTMARGVPHVND